MRFKNYIISILLYTFVFVLIGCEGEPLLTALSTDQVTLVFKGTYASNNPRNWWDGQSSDNLSALSFADDSAVDIVESYFLSTGSDVSDAFTDKDKNKITADTGFIGMPTRYMIDIAEMRFNGDTFAHDRYYRDTSFSDEDPIWSGVGVQLGSEDLSDGESYDKISVYFRKLIIDQAILYDEKGNWEPDEKITEAFALDELDGYDFIQHLEYVQEAVDLDDEENIIYPYDIEMPYSFKYDIEKKYVIEVRVVLKNYLKYYQYTDDDDDYYSFFATGDAIYNIKDGDVYLGGNLVGGFHVYTPGQTCTLTGTAPSNSYVVAIYESDDISNYYVSGESGADLGSVDTDSDGDSDGHAIDTNDDGVPDGIDTNGDDAIDEQWPEDLSFDEVTIDDDDEEFSQQVVLIPPMATWCSDGTFTLENVPVGKSYKLYYSSNTPDPIAAELVTGFEGELEVTVESDQAGDEISVGSL